MFEAAREPGERHVQGIRHVAGTVLVRLAHIHEQALLLIQKADGLGAADPPHTVQKLGQRSVRQYRQRQNDAENQVPIISDELHRGRSENLSA